MTKIAIVYFSGYGHTTKIADAVAEGARSVDGADVTIFQIDESGDIPEAWLEELAGYDAMIYGSPTYMGSVAWQFKKFADMSSKPWFTQAWRDKVAGGFTNSATVNGDKSSTISYLVTLAMQHGQVWVGPGQKSANTKDAGPDDLNWTGGYTGLLAISPADASPDEAPRKGDLDTARLYGARIAHVAATVAAGNGDWPKGL